MDNIWIQFALLAALVVLNGVLAGSEMALVSLRESQARRLGGHGRRGRALLRLYDEPNRFLSAVQIGITLAGFLASASAAVTLADRLASRLDLLGSWASPFSVLAVTAILTFFTLVFGELAPKRIAMQRAEGWSIAVARPLSWFVSAAWPLVWFLGKATNAVVRILGLDPGRQRTDVTEEEFRDMLVTSGEFTATEREVISGAFDLGDRTLAQVVRPRPEVFTLDADVDAEEALRLLASSGHSRAPVVGPRGLDDLLGVVHLRDLVGATGAVEASARPSPVLPETLGALDALRRLQAERQTMAVVLNEHLTVEGIVTIEDLLEEIVGEIYDEIDRDVRAVQRDPAGSLLLPGTFPVHDLADLGIEVPPGPYSTLAGVIISRLERLPPRYGDSVVAGGWRLTVVGVRRLTVTKVRIAPVGPRRGSPPREAE